MRKWSVTLILISLRHLIISKVNLKLAKNSKLQGIHSHVYNVFRSTIWSKEPGSRRTNLDPNQTQIKHFASDNQSQKRRKPDTPRAKIIMVLILDGNSVIQVQAWRVKSAIIEIDRLVFRHTCATYSELPSKIITNRWEWFEKLCRYLLRVIFLNWRFLEPESRKIWNNF